MSIAGIAKELFDKYVNKMDHSGSDYFALIGEFVSLRISQGDIWQEYINKAYELLLDEMKHNTAAPRTPVKFGTSGWRGILGKDVNVKSASFVTAAIVDLYEALDYEPLLRPLLGTKNFAEAKEKGCVVGFDNRFGGEVLAGAVVEVLKNAGFEVHYAGESSTGVLSAAVLELNAAFSINLTPSHNPMAYGGFKYNAFDGGPAESVLTERITANSQRIFESDETKWKTSSTVPPLPSTRDDLNHIDSLRIWKDLVRENAAVHGVEYHELIAKYESNTDVVVVIDSVHGASRLHIKRLFENTESKRLIHLRSEDDVTFGGIAPEPSSVNMQGVMNALKKRKESLKIGAIIDPDADRIRFTDGINEISMNQFGAMAYHFLHEVKGKKGMVAKTVATSNLANAIALKLNEKLFEPKVGFKEFKPVIGEAIVLFEESDGISIIGHTPEKDAYIGLLLALDMVLSRGINLGDYLKEIEQEFGAYYPDRDGIEVKLKGVELLDALAKLEVYSVGDAIMVGSDEKFIKEIISIDGRKFVFEDNSWLMIRPSGTEPKIRFYVESRDQEGTAMLVDTAKALLKEIGL